MPLFDMPLPELETYLPKLTAQADFDSFWNSTLNDTQQHDLNPIFTETTFGYATVDVFDVSFSGFAGQSIKGWLLLPRHRDDSLPCVVEYIGYGGGRGYPHDWLIFSAFGYAHLVMDTRGQGSRWLHGDTPDNASDGQTPQYPGFMTRGILSPESYYYRRLMTDAVRAVDLAQAHPEIDSKRIVVAGGSQGGGLALAVAGLRDNLAGVITNVPFLCNFERAIHLIDTAPYNEIAHYLKIHRQTITQVEQTLSYFDGINFASRATAPALFSVGLMDDVCPPSTVYGAYNHYQGKKEMRVYEFNNHEGGGSHHILEQIRFLHQIVPLS
ncbi:MAG: acetylxylan esterase [Chloroflexota bacterium]